MRSNKLFILFIMFFSITFAKSSVDDLMKKANDLYVQGQFEDAIKIYNSLIGEGYEGTSLFYNLGNAYYRTGKIGYAILYYEKALKHSPDDEDVMHNLQLAQLNIVDKIEALPSFFVFRIWETVLGFFSSEGWLILSYILLLVVLFALGFYFFAQNITQQRIAFYSFVFVLVLFFASVSLMIVKLNQEENLRFGVVLESSLTAKSSPDPQGKDAFVIHEGLKVRVEDKVDKWVKIRLEDGQVGWVENFSVGII
ncbi:tetratricopeptide repeat protein [Ignavibacterium sp.]|uniref:tetratricopeptide repeat protein n=1 Tax=Ignavibacterium sp. TaxID=2651167 RepID=UPI00307E576A